MNDTACWLALSNVDGLGPTHFQQGLQYFSGSVESFWNASSIDLQHLGFSPRLIQNFENTRRSIDIDFQLKKLNELGATVITLTDSNYPSRLKLIHDPPPILYVLGELNPADDLSVAVVGSRRMTSYGKEVTRTFVEGLTANRLTIVSGLALGVDACAHESALRSGGRTLAVLGSGIDVIAPVENQFLARRIVSEKRGAIISEFCLGTVPQKFTFPRRNRIISGLSLGVLVTEAAERSGALITAHQAIEQGRDVFAVPGSIFNPMTLGTHRLINEGAKLVNSVSDILEELRLNDEILRAEARIVVGESPNEEAVLKIIGNDELHIDRIIQISALEPSVTISTLTILELKGLVKKLDNQTYRLSH